MRRSYVRRTYFLTLSALFLLVLMGSACESNPNAPTAGPTPTPAPTGDLEAVPIDPAEAPTGCDDPIWDSAPELSVLTQTVSSSQLYGDGELNMTGTFGGTDSLNVGDPADLRLTALYTTGSGVYNALSEQDKKDLRLRVMGFWGVPGYYLRLPVGGDPKSEGDIVTITDLDFSQAGIDALTPIGGTVQGPSELNKYKFQQEGYCVVIIRDLDTGHSDDKQFTDLSAEYVFGVALMENDGKNHIGNKGRSRLSSLVCFKEHGTNAPFAKLSHPEVHFLGQSACHFTFP